MLWSWAVYILYTVLLLCVSEPLSFPLCRRLPLRGRGDSCFLLRAKTVTSRVQVKKQVQRDELDNAFAKFERFERKVDNLEGELQAMDLGRDTASNLAAEIDALGEDDWLDEELLRIKDSMAEADQSGDAESKKT